MAEGRRELSEVPLIKVVIPHRRAPPSTPNHLPKAYLPKPSPWGLSFNVWIGGGGGGTNIPSTAVTVKQLLTLSPLGFWCTPDFWTQPLVCPEQFLWGLHVLGGIYFMAYTWAIVKNAFVSKALLASLPVTLKHSDIHSNGSKSVTVSTF